MLRVTLDIYSGRQNPSWLLSDKEESELLDRVMGTPDIMLPILMKTGGLGYRGFIVEVEKDDGISAWSRTRSKNSQIQLPSLFRIGGNYDEQQVAQQWMLETSYKESSEVDDFLREISSEGMLKQKEVKSASQKDQYDFDYDEANQHIGIVDSSQVSGRGPGMSCSSNYFSGTDFTDWNRFWNVRRNNCYCFGANHMKGSFGLPGRKGGSPVTPDDLSKSTMENALIADGWKHNCDSANNLTIACVVWQDHSGYRDFHFYRTVTSTGIWGHKQGENPAETIDESGETIYDPETCDRGEYHFFYGYFYQDNSTTTIA